MTRSCCYLQGEFISKFPVCPHISLCGSIDKVKLIPGHEAIGRIAAMGDKVKGFEIGDRIVGDVGGEPHNVSSF